MPNLITKIIHYAVAIMMLAALFYLGMSVGWRCQRRAVRDAYARGVNAVQREAFCNGQAHLRRIHGKLRFQWNQPGSRGHLSDVSE